MSGCNVTGTGACIGGGAGTGGFTGGFSSIELPLGSVIDRGNGGSDSCKVYLVALEGLQT
jgi:hypothetical protein